MNGKRKTKTKQQVFALAKKHDIPIQGHVDTYWKTCQCEWDVPEGKTFGDRHSAYYECDMAEWINRNDGVRNAKEFWTGMYEELENDIKNMGDCTESICDYCGRYE